MGATLKKLLQLKMLGGVDKCLVRDGFEEKTNGFYRTLAFSRSAGVYTTVHNEKIACFDNS
jgi:hypothetical protein